MKNIIYEKYNILNNIYFRSSNMKKLKKIINSIKYNNNDLLNLNSDSNIKLKKLKKNDFDEKTKNYIQNELNQPIENNEIEIWNFNLGK